MSPCGRLTFCNQTFHSRVRKQMFGKGRWILFEGKVFGAVNDDSKVVVRAFQVIGNPAVEYDFAAFVAAGCGVHEVGAVGFLHGDADMGGVGGLVAAGDGDDVSCADVFLDRCDFFFWDVVDWQCGDLFLNLRHACEERRVVAKVAIAFPSGGHFVDIAVEWFAAEFASRIYG